MNGWARFLIGFVLGLLLTGAGFVLAGVGHGTYAPLICNTGLVGFVFLPFSLFAAPFQWGFYLAFIPFLSSSRWRTVCIVVVILTDLIPGLWLAMTDTAFSRAMNSDQTELLIYGTILLTTLVVLVLHGIRGTATTTSND